MKAHKRNQVRIIGGQYRGRLLDFPQSDGLRPTPDRVRETLFNWLGQNLTGQVVLDLFAGSGALGFEAASRGAAEVVMVDVNAVVVRSLFANQQKICSENTIIIKNSAEQYLHKCHKKFDIILLDPPFVFDEWTSLFQQLKPLLDSQVFIYVEAPEKPACFEGLTEIRSGKAGQTRQWLLQSDNQVNSTAKLEAVVN